MSLLTSLLVGKPLNILAVAALFGVAHVARFGLTNPELTSVETVRSGLTQAEACGLHPAHAQLERAPV